MISSLPNFSPTLFFLKIDKRPHSSVMPASCWLRGKQEANFPVAPASLFDEWNLHARIWKQNDWLKAYFNVAKPDAS